MAEALPRKRQNVRTLRSRPTGTTESSTLGEGPERQPIQDCRQIPARLRCLFQNGDRTVLRRLPSQVLHQGQNFSETGLMKHYRPGWESNYLRRSPIFCVVQAAWLGN